MPAPRGLPFESPLPPSLLLQRFIVDRPPDTRGLYWHAFPVEPGTTGRQVEVSGSTLVVPSNTRLNFDTYFNTFSESLWRRHGYLGLPDLPPSLTASDDENVFVFDPVTEASA